MKAYVRCPQVFELHRSLNGERTIRSRESVVTGLYPDSDTWKIWDREKDRLFFLRLEGNDWVEVPNPEK